MKQNLKYTDYVNFYSVTAADQFHSDVFTDLSDLIAWYLEVITRLFSYRPIYQPLVSTSARGEAEGY